MAGYADQINRTDDAGVLVPEATVKEVIKALPQQSALLSLARRVPLSTKRSKQPILSALPDAYWVNGDTGLKQTTKESWANLYIEAEELATIVVIPDALFDDADIPLWDEVQPYLIEAIGRKVDQAGIFGVDKPASWPTPIYSGAVAAGNTTYRGTGTDIGVEVARLGEMVELDGYAVNGFASRPGLQWSLQALRDTNGQPIYGQAVGGNGGPGLYGYPLNEVKNGAWDAAKATIIAADWSKFVIGIRQDITFKIFDSGVISDSDGKVIVNLMQQDAKALRVVFRVGFVAANPITALNGDSASRYPAAVLRPSLAS